jgi:hypothetical protein
MPAARPAQRLSRLADIKSTTQSFFLLNKKTHYTIMFKTSSSYFMPALPIDAADFITHHGEVMHDSEESSPLMHEAML